jgi:hypothetical protein
VSESAGNQFYRTVSTDSKRIDEIAKRFAELVSSYTDENGDIVLETSLPSEAAAYKARLHSVAEEYRAIRNELDEFKAKYTVLVADPSTTGLSPSDHAEARAIVADLAKNIEYTHDEVNRALLALLKALTQIDDGLDHL